MAKSGRPKAPKDLAESMRELMRLRAEVKIAEQRANVIGSSVSAKSADRRSRQVAQTLKR
jgi:hypothetical protein